LFSPSRRPPAPAVAPRIQTVAPAPAAPTPPPERAQFSVVGTVVRDAESIAVLFDQRTRETFRLKVGQEHDGWLLREVVGRTITVEKRGQVEMIALPAPSQGAASGETQKASADFSQPADSAVPNGARRTSPSGKSVYSPESPGDRGPLKGLDDL